MTNQNPGHEQALSDSYIDVVFASFHDEDVVEGNFRAYDRLETLGAASGEHFFRLGSFGAFKDLVIGDYPEELAVAFPGRQLREAVLQEGHKLSHYIFDIANDQIVVVNNELREDNKDRIVYDANTPAHFTREREPSLEVVARRAGSGYNKWLGNRIMAMELLSDDSVVEGFLAATDSFVRDCVIHAKPQVTQVLY